MAEEIQTVPQITRGEQKEIVIQILNEDGSAKDMTGIGAFFTTHLKEDNNYLIKSNTDSLFPLVQVSVGSNKIKCILSKDETKLLKVQTRAVIFCAVDFPQPLGRKIFKIIDAYDVNEARFVLP